MREKKIIEKNNKNLSTSSNRVSNFNALLKCFTLLNCFFIKPKKFFDQPKQTPNPGEGSNPGFGVLKVLNIPKVDHRPLSDYQISLLIYPSLLNRFMHLVRFQRLSIMVCITTKINKIRFLFYVFQSEMNL